MDIDNAEDFSEMAKKISEMKPEKVQVFIDMKNVEKLAHNKVFTTFTSMYYILNVIKL